MSFKFLKPRLANVLLTLIVLSLPILRERAWLPTGGYVVAAYRPILMLVSYLQIKAYYQFFLTVSFSLVVYAVVSVVVTVVSKLLKKKGK